MGKLDVTFMHKNKKGTFGRPVPKRDLVSYFKKTGPNGGDRGPFTIMLDLDARPEDLHLLQLTVDFNEHKTVGGDPVICLSQLGRADGLIPENAQAAGPGSYPFEEWRKSGETWDDIAGLVKGPEDDLGRSRYNRFTRKPPGTGDDGSGDTDSGE